MVSVPHGGMVGWDTHRMGIAKTSRVECCVCVDPATLEAADYVELAVQAPDSQGTQSLGAHRGCLNRVFQVEVIVGE